MDKTKICKFSPTIFESWLSGIKPPDDITVKAKLNESSNRISTKLYKIIIEIVDTKYIAKILMKL